MNPKEPLRFNEAAYIDGFGERMRAQRETAGLTQHALAKRSAVNRSTIAMLEAGRQHPTFVQIARIAKALGLSATELIGF